MVEISLRICQAPAQLVSPFQRMQDNRPAGRQRSLEISEVQWYNRVKSRRRIL